MRTRQSCSNTYSPTLNEYIPGNACLTLTTTMSAEFCQRFGIMYSLQTLHHEQVQVVYDYLKLEFA